MTKRQYICCHINSFMAIFMLTGMGLLATSAKPLHAQSYMVDSFDLNVSVDLSVLEDGRTGAISSGQIRAYRSNNTSSPFGPLIPTLGPPISLLHIKPQNANASSSSIANRVIQKLRRPEKRAPKIRRPIAAPKLPPIPALVNSNPVIKASPVVAVVAIAPPPPPAKLAPVAKRKNPPMPIAARVRAPVDLKSIKAPPPPPAIIKTILKPEPTTKTQLTSKTEQTASIVPRASGIKAGTEMRVVFNLRESKLPEGAKKSLLAVTNKMKAAVTLRLRLQAYAGSESMSSSKARRLSLSRALSVRSYLIKSGIQSSRIDVRALGNKSTEKPINRVDVNVVER